LILLFNFALRPDFLSPRFLVPDHKTPPFSFAWRSAARSLLSLSLFPPFFPIFDSSSTVLSSIIDVHALISKPPFPPPFSSGERPMRFHLFRSPNVLRSLAMYPFSDWIATPTPSLRSFFFPLGKNTFLQFLYEDPFSQKAFLVPQYFSSQVPFFFCSACRFHGRTVRFQPEWWKATS